MTLKEWLYNKFGALFRKRINSGAQVEEEIEKLLENGNGPTNEGFIEKLKDENPVTDPSKSFTEKFDELVTKFQREESGLAPESSDANEKSYSKEDVLKIILGATLERLNVSKMQALELIKGISRVDLAQPLLWPVKYIRDDKTVGDPPILIPATREIDSQTLEDSQNILELRDYLKNAVKTIDGGRGFTISAKSIEKYHGEDCCVNYTCSYMQQSEGTSYSVAKEFKPELTTSGKDIRHVIVVQKNNGQLGSIEEISEGHLEDKDNYYFKSYSRPGDNTVQVVCGKEKSLEDVYDISYAEENLGIHSYDSSIAKQLNEMGQTTKSDEGKKALSKLQVLRKKEIAANREVY